MADLAIVRDRLLAEGKLGPAARLGPTEGAFTLRGPGAGMVIDGPFAETKEQLLGFYVIDCANREEAVEAARSICRVFRSRLRKSRKVRGISIP